MVTGAAVGVGVTAASDDGVDVAPGDGVDVAPGDGVPVTAVLVAALVRITARSSSFAEDSIRLRVSSSSLPAMLTTTLLPWVTISASLTPEASTRWRIIRTARFSWSAVAVWPDSSLGARTISVPPSRSSPSLGVHDPFAHSTPARLIPARRTMRAPSKPSERQALRTGVGRDERLGDAATCSAFCGWRPAHLSDAPGWVCLLVLCSARKKTPGLLLVGSLGSLG